LLGKRADDVESMEENPSQSVKKELFLVAISPNSVGKNNQLVGKIHSPPPPCFGQ